jgi:hypothetical protein
MANTGTNCCQKNGAWEGREPRKHLAPHFIHNITSYLCGVLLVDGVQQVLQVFEVHDRQLQLADPRLHFLVQPAHTPQVLIHLDTQGTDVPRLSHSAKKPTPTHTIVDQRRSTQASWQ